MKSKCCNAKLGVVCGKEGTYYFYCLHCMNSCNPYFEAGYQKALDDIIKMLPKSKEIVSKLMKKGLEHVV